MRSASSSASETPASDSDHRSAPAGPSPRSRPSARSRVAPASDTVRRALWLEAVLEDEFGMDAEDAKMICGVVIDQFGDKDELLDDEVPTDVRSIFYTLESKRILTFRRIEYKGDEGETRRGFFWRFHLARLEKRYEQALEATAAEDEDPYAELPASCWNRPTA